MKRLLKSRMTGFALALLCAGLLLGCQQGQNSQSESDGSGNAFVDVMTSRFGDESEPVQLPDPAGASASVTDAEALQALQVYYPDGAQLAYRGEKPLHGQPAHIFMVTDAGENLVSRAAVTVATGEVWFLDMCYGDGLDEDWRGPEWYGLENWTGEPEDAPAPEAHYEYIPPREADGQRGVSLNNLPGLAEFPAPNWFTAFYDPATQELNVDMLKNTGTVTGAPDGPTVKLVASLASGQPVLVSHESTPAPAYSNPRLVLKSGELLTLDEARMAELARYFYDIIKACEAEYPGATGNVEFEALAGFF